MVCYKVQSLVLIYSKTMVPLAKLIQSYEVNFYGYADDIQLYITFKPGEDEERAHDRL